MFQGMFEKTDRNYWCHLRALKKKTRHKVASFHLSEFDLAMEFKSTHCSLPCRAVPHTSYKFLSQLPLGTGTLWETLGSEIHKATSQNPRRAFEQ